MTDTTVATGNQVTKWQADFWAEFVRASRFAKYTGTGSNNVFVEKEDAGNYKAISVPLIGRLTGAGVSGTTKLEDAEEALDNYNHDLDIVWKRNGIVRTKDQQSYTVIDLLNAGREMLMRWAMEEKRDDIIAALASVNGVAYGSATEGKKEDCQAANADRVLFGSAVGNATGDQSLDLAKVDNTNDKLTSSVGSLAKRLAMTADPRIHPIRVNDDEEWFVMFCGALAFRDLQADSALQQATREAWARGPNNPLFTGGDLIRDGVIYREVPEIPVLSGVGAGAIDVSQNYLCGAQAVGVGYGQRPTVQSDTRDYGFRKGVAIECAWGIEKMEFKTETNKVDHGVVTVYAAGVADA